MINTKYLEDNYGIGFKDIEGRHATKRMIQDEYTIIYTYIYNNVKDFTKIKKNLLNAADKYVANICCSRLFLQNNYIDLYHLHADEAQLIFEELNKLIKTARKRKWLLLVLL